MTHTYNISGMTCTGCETKVKGLLSKVPGVSGVSIDLAKGQADVTMATHIATEKLRAALQEYPKYQLTEAGGHHMAMEETTEETKTWFQTYKPILLIFGYVLGISAVASLSTGLFDWMTGMRVFMAGFFIAFSFFKMLDLNGFADSYSTYDIIARKFRGWGFAGIVRPNH